VLRARAGEVDTEDWSSRVLDRIEKERARIPNTPGESYKAGILGARRARARAQGTISLTVFGERLLKTQKVFMD